MTECGHRVLLHVRVCVCVEELVLLNTSVLLFIFSLIFLFWGAFIIVCLPFFSIEADGVKTTRWQTTSVFTERHNDRLNLHQSTLVWMSSPRGSKHVTCQSWHLHTVTYSRHWICAVDIRACMRDRAGCRFKGLRKRFHLHRKMISCQECGPH